jgi:hypothetical protein
MGLPRTVLHCNLSEDVEFGCEGEERISSGSIGHLWG